MNSTIQDQCIIIYYNNTVLCFQPKLSDNNEDFNKFFEHIENLNFTEAITECTKLEEKYITSTDYSTSLGEVYTNLGAIYFINKDYDLMEKYYLLAIELGNCIAMGNFAEYNYINAKYELVEKYYLMAIELNDDIAMNNLGTYHIRTTKKYDLAEKYLMMAINLNNKSAMTNFAYYCSEQKNYELMEKYYLMAIDLNHCLAMHRYGHYLINSGKKTDGYKYLVMAKEQGFKYDDQLLSTSNWTKRYLSIVDNKKIGNI